MKAATIDMNWLEDLIEKAREEDDNRSYKYLMEVHKHANVMRDLDQLAQDALNERRRKEDEEAEKRREASYHTWLENEKNKSKT